MNYYFKYTINFLDPVQTAFQPAKVENVFGKEEAPMALKDAMKKNKGKGKPENAGNGGGNPGKGNGGGKGKGKK